ncbi:MAG: Gfo/Idh/MocA family oxidoreductase, partial [Planctomycetota bacterium]|nr:Gfo/Idh/MocA family oxidoreductase [Planctomycetota bacterium]
MDEHPDCDIDITFDLDAEAAQRRADEAQARAVTDLDELLGSDADVVVICTPTPSHPELVLRAAEAGKHVMCEKPMALTLKDCRRMIDACEQAGVKLAIGHTIRFFGTFRTVRRLVAEGAIGAPVAGTFDRMGTSKPRPASDAPRWSGHWREDPRNSGGHVLEGFIHELDCTRSVFGTVASVAAEVAGNQDYDGWMSPQIVQGLV